MQSIAMARSIGSPSQFGNRRGLVDNKVELGISLLEQSLSTRLDSHTRHGIVDQRTVGPMESKHTAAGSSFINNLHSKSALMHAAVMVWTELHNVVQRRGSAIRPMRDMVTVPRAAFKLMPHFQFSQCAHELQPSTPQPSRKSNSARSQSTGQPRTEDEAAELSGPCLVPHWRWPTF